MTKIKICGLSRPEDISAVNRSLPDYIGFVFAASRRRISEEKAALLKAKLDNRITAVGIFVNAGIETIESLCRSRVIDMIQLHGDEDLSYIMRLKERCDCPVIKAIGVGTVLPPMPGGVPPMPGSADYYLFDTLSGARGGTGTAFDWSVLKRYQGPPYFLAGGLDETNIPQAVALLSPFCVDISSAAETNGLKDPDKIERMVRIIRDSAAR